MELKSSRWLSISTRLLQARVTLDTENSEQFIEELNLRRETVSKIKTPFFVQSNAAIEGVYQVVGANSENAEQGYVGMLRLIYEDNRIFASWLIEGEDIQTGFGLLIGNMLSISFIYKQNGMEHTGLVSYEFLSDTVLYGTWIEQGTSTIGVEYGRKLPIEIEDPLKYFGFN